MEMNQHLPPRKRLLAGYKKLNGSSSSSSSSTTSYSNGSSSSASNDVQTRIDDLFASRLDNEQNRSPEELVEATRKAAELAVEAAKAARARANEKALISAKAIAKAKRALELVDSFGPKNIKQRKHVPLKVLYSKGWLRDEEEEDLARRLQRVIDNKYPKVLRNCSGFEENGHGSKKQKTGSGGIVTGSTNDNAEGVDSDCSYEELESNRRMPKAALEVPDEVDSDATLVKEEETNSFGICNSKDQEETGVSSSSAAVAHGLFAVSSSWKCKQELKAPECVKQNNNKAVRSS